MHTGERHPPTPQSRGVGEPPTIEQEHIETGRAVMGRARAQQQDRAQHDVEVDLGGGVSTVYRQGEHIPPQHRGLPSKRASLPKGMTTQHDEDERPRGDLASDRLADGVG